jgi:hypothetical protein
MPRSVPVGKRHERVLLVIWRLPHPVRGIFTFLLVFVTGWMLGAMLDTFGMGLPELALLALLAAGAGLLVATRTSGDSVSSS